MADLRVENVGKSFPTRGEPLVVLREISFELTAGQNLAILGPSGSGKSTLLQVIGSLDTPTTGSVTLIGQNLFQLAEPELARYRNRMIGFVFQEHHLLPQLSVLENVLVPALAEGRPGPKTVDRARMLIDRVGLSHRADHRPAELSGGERQRAAVARALLHRPSLLLADEPTGSLDRTNAEAIGQLLIELQVAEQTMLIVVTHSIDLANRLQRRMEIDEGRLREIC